MSKDLARLFAPPTGGSGTQALMGGTCTAWNATGSHSTVVVGTVTYTDLPILGSALATMGTGTVLLLRTPASYIIAGRLTLPG